MKHSVSSSGKHVDRQIASVVATLTRAKVRALTARIQEVGGVNMGQGSNLLPTPAPLIDAAYHAMKCGQNDYSVQEGIPELRAEIATMIEYETSLRVDPRTQVRITSGASGGFFSACRTLLEPGTEAIIFEPFYPYHVAAIALTGSNIRFLREEPPEWKIDLGALQNICGPQTRLLVLCNPTNPTCKVYRRDELQALVTFCRDRGIIVVSDEVYGSLTYDGREHVSIASLPGAAEHVVTVASFCSVFGWIRMMAAASSVSSKGSGTNTSEAGGRFGTAICSSRLSVWVFIF